MSDQLGIEISYKEKKVFVKNEAVIGRELKAAVCIPDPGVSREHAKIYRTENGWEIIDQSLNGFTVGNQKSIKGQIIKLPYGESRTIVIEGGNREHHSIRVTPLKAKEMCEVPPPQKKAKLADTSNNMNKLKETESQILQMQTNLNESLRDSNQKQNELSVQKKSMEKTYRIRLQELSNDYESKIQELEGKIRLGEKLQSDKNLLEKEFAAETDKLVAARELERQEFESQLKSAQSEIEKLQTEKLKVEEECQKELEELKKKLEEKQVEFENAKERELIQVEEKRDLEAKIKELQALLVVKEEKLKESEKVEEAVHRLDPAVLAAISDMCEDGEEVLVTIPGDSVLSQGGGSGQPSTSQTDAMSRAQLEVALEELRREREAREELQREMRRNAEGVEEVLESELSCSVCSELFVKPITLPCQHTFCSTCILQWQRSQKDCPMCRAKFQDIGQKNLLVTNCIAKFVERTFGEDEKKKREELLKSREELEKTLLPISRVSTLATVGSSTSSTAGTSGASNIAAVATNLLVVDSRNAIQAAIEEARSASSAAMRNNRRSYAASRPSPAVARQANAHPSRSAQVVPTPPVSTQQTRPQTRGSVDITRNTRGHVAANRRPAQGARAVASVPVRLDSQRPRVRAGSPNVVPIRVQVSQGPVRVSGSVGTHGPRQVISATSLGNMARGNAPSGQIDQMYPARINQNNVFLQNGQIVSNLQNGQIVRMDTGGTTRYIVVQNVQPNAAVQRVPQAAPAADIVAVMQSTTLPEGRENEEAGRAPRRDFVQID